MGPIAAGTILNSTSGTVADFNIPSWANRITVLLAGVSLSGTGLIRFQLGTASAFTTSGYGAVGSVISSGAASASQTSGFDIYTNVPNASHTYSGAINFERIGGNSWVATGLFSGSPGWTHTTAGVIGLAAALTRVRVTSSNGTDTFDAGFINVLYE